MQNQKYILVTGAAGYIGSHTVVELIASGYTPVLVDDFRNSNKVVLKGISQIVQKELILFETDVCNYASMRKLFEEFNFAGIIHFAAYKAVGESVENPLKYYRNNIDALLTVLELMQEFKVSSFVFSSSCTVYGEPDVKEVSEKTDLKKANSPYGSTKLIGEQILTDLFISSPDTKIINLRYFNPIGAHPSGLIGEFPIGKPSNLLPFITQTAIGKLNELTVFGNDYPTVDGTCVRDFIHVCDLASAHVKALSFLENIKNGCNEHLNIGTGKGTTVLELITSFETISSQKLNWKFGPKRPGDVCEIYANVDRAEKLLDWKSRYTIEDAVRHAWIWEKNLHHND